MQQIKRSLGLLTLTVFVAVLLLQVVPPRSAHAAQITTRRLTLQQGSVDTNADGINDGGSMPGGTVRHFFEFNLPGGTNIGSIKFEYCTTAAPVTGGVNCNVPTNMDATNATLGAETGATGFSLASASPNTVVIARASAAAASGAVSYRLDSVLNPSPTNQTFFVRISTHASLDGTGASVDTGSVAASTATPIVISGTMPESLVFCTGATVSTTSGVPDCTTATAGNISFDQLFTPTDISTTRSQMAASTNAGTGYAITVNGPTLTSGANTILGMSNGSGGPTAPILGTSQFGLNLVLNTTTMNNAGTPVALGLDVAPANNGTNYKGRPSVDYRVDDVFEFTSGDTVAASDDPALGGTDAQIFTVGYIVNVPGSQPAGTYTTTLTYICTATF
jgi:hypothetical protein